MDVLLRANGQRIRRRRRNHRLRLREGAVLRPALEEPRPVEEALAGDLRHQQRVRAGLGQLALQHHRRGVRVHVEIRPQLGQRLRAIEGLKEQPRRSRRGRAPVAANVQAIAPVLLVDGGHDGRGRAAEAIPRRLGPRVVVDDGPAAGRPAVVEHPVNQSGREPLLPPVQLHGDAHPLVLHILPLGDFVLRAARRAQQLVRDGAQIVVNLKLSERLGGIVLRVEAQHALVVAEDVLIRQKSPQRRGRRHAHHRLLGAEARQIAVEIRAVVLHVVMANVGEPLSDVVGVVGRAPGDGAVGPAAVGTGGQEGPVGIQLLQHRADGAQRRAPAAVIHHVLVAVHAVFVVTRPPDQTGVAAQPQRRVPRLHAQMRQEIVAPLGIAPAGHQEILRDHQAQPVAGLVKRVLLEDAAAPDADHVHVRLLRHAQQPLDLLRRLLRGERLAGHPVRALAEDGHAVDDQPKAGEFVLLVAIPEGVFARDVRALLELQALFEALAAGQIPGLEDARRANAHRESALVQHPLAVLHRRRQPVQRLLAIAVGPPQPRLLHVDDFRNRVLDNPAPLRPDHRAVGILKRQAAEVLLPRPAKLRLHEQLRAEVVQTARLRAQIVHLAALRAMQTDRPEDSHGHEAIHPVP